MYTAEEYTTVFCLSEEYLRLLCWVVTGTNEQATALARMYPHPRKFVPKPYSRQQWLDYLLWQSKEMTALLREHGANDPTQSVNAGAIPTCDSNRIHAGESAS